MKLLPVLLLFAAVGCSSPSAHQADYDVVPAPRELSLTGGDGFVFDASTVIAVPGGDSAMMRNASFLADYLADFTGTRPEIVGEAPKAHAIVLTSGLETESPEAYTMDIDKNLIKINGASPAGCFYGVQTLRKSVPAGIKAGDRLTFPAAGVADAPRFGYRGTELDCARHFFEADSVKCFIDMLAMHNLNRFHWHLTDDQGWRIEIKKYPRLTEVGAWRKGTMKGLLGNLDSMQYDSVPHGGFYTQEQIRDIVAYAAERNIDIIPEIDLPGHMVAALTAYPELGCTGGPYEVWQRWGVSTDVLCAGNPKTLEFLDDVITEVMDLFPSEYIHIGGDECPKQRWEECARCQAKIRQLGLTADKHSTAEQKLQNHIMEHVSGTLAARGRKMLGWDEILEGGLFPGAGVMAWRSPDAAVKAARQGHDAVQTPKYFCYLDYSQSTHPASEPLTSKRYLPLAKTYSLEPVSPELTADEANHILGAQVNLWTEYAPTFDAVMYKALPRVAALAEATWSQPDKKDYDAFLDRLNRLMDHYNRAGYNYSREVFEAEGIVEQRDGKSIVRFRTVDGAPVRYTLDGSEPDGSSPLYSEELTIDSTADIRAAAFRNGTKGRTWSGHVNHSKSRGATVSLVEPSIPKYSYAGASMLNDGLTGDRNVFDANWIGFRSDKGMDVVLDLGQPTEVSRVSFNALNSASDYIFACEAASVELSDDGETYTPVGSTTYSPADSEGSQTPLACVFTFEPRQTRYVRVKATPCQSIPAWHGSNGRKSNLFVDEIEID